MDTPPLPPPTGDNPEIRQWKVILHLSALVGIILVGFGHLLGPLLVWLIKKNDVEGMDREGRAVLDFQISWTIWMFLSLMVGLAGSCLIVPMAIPLGFFIAWLVFTIRGAVGASNGEAAAFPWTLRFLS